jgi:hypothetical protein
MIRGQLPLNGIVDLRNMLAQVVEAEESSDHGHKCKKQWLEPCTVSIK